MQDNYRADPARRPECFDPDGVAAGVSCRTFLCARCRDRVVICSRCDRGQIYCANGCAQIARRAAQREAGRRYQRSRDGRFAHAKRNWHYRRRRKNVTHQGSPAVPARGLVVLDPILPIGPPVLGQCHWCGCPCPAFVRQTFLRRRGPGPHRLHPHQGPRRHDHSP